MNDSHLFKLAKECSFQADYSGCCNAKIGCIITYHGSVIAKGCNSDKTHTKQAYFNRMRYKDSGNHYLPAKLHAEMVCLQKVQYLDIDFSKVHIYTYRELKNGKMAMSRPCRACMEAIKQMHIKHIHYSTEDGFAREDLI